jgi:aspartate kinase
MATQATSAEIVVMKFGGTSVAGAEQIKRAAARIVAAREEGKSVVAVLSARGKTTDELAAMAKEVAERPDPREMDMLLSTGERISCALCAMAIVELGHKAISLTGSQAGIVTDSSHTKARIIDVRADRIRAALEEDSIVLVAGFQGVSTDSRDVTTLGRGGSDTTAVALAAALGGEVCEIYTDVAGVYSADPRIVPDARKLSVVSYEEMLEMAASGAKVLQLRSVEYARNHGVQIHCRSSSEDGPGTLVVSEQETLERPLVTAVTHSTDEARVTLTGVRDEPGIAGRILRALADNNINVDMIIQNEPVSSDDGADLSFTVESDDLSSALDALKGLDVSEKVETDARTGKVSIVGAGMRSHPGVAAKVFETLGEEKINIEMISTSPIKISCVIAADRVDDAVKALHKAFELGADAIRKEEPTGTEHRPTVAS